MSRPQHQRRRHGERRTGEIRGALLKACAAAVALATCAFLAVAGWGWARRSPRFAVQKVTFHGLERASEPELLKLSGLAPGQGQNLLSLDLGAATRAMAAHPWVKEVQARRRFPGAVEVTVREHVPAAVLSMGELYAVDAEGSPFEKLQAGDAVDLPLVSGVDRDQYLQDRARWEARIRQALELAALYQARFPGPAYRLSEVRLSPFGLSVVDGPDGEEVHLGDSSPSSNSDFAEKLDRLQLVRRALAQRSLVAEMIRLDDRKRPARVAVRASTPSATSWGTATERSGAPRPTPEKGKAR